MSPLPRTAFFFGAGVSTADDVPGTVELTRAVQARISNEGLGPLWEALAFEARGLDLGQNRGDINYEDVCYLAGQVADALLGEFDNAAVGALVHRLNTRLEGWLSALSDRKDGSWSPSDARDWLRVTCERLVSDAKSEVAEKLSDAVADKEPPLRAYQALVDAAQDPDLPHMDVFTLNHDLLLEKTLHHANVRYRVVIPDTPDGEAEPGIAEADSVRVNIYKLHGCVSWEFKYKDARHVWEGRFVVRRAGMNLASSPVILVGRFNKMLLQANDPVFFDLLRRFAARLAKTQYLIVSGYSFSDKGINTFLFDWLGWRSMGRRMLVVHAAPKKLVAGARPMAGGIEGLQEPHGWGNLQTAAKRGDVSWVTEWFHNVRWENDLKRELQGSQG